VTHRVVVHNVDEEVVEWYIRMYGPPKVFERSGEEVVMEW